MFKKSLLITLLLALLMPCTLKAYTLTVGDQSTQDEHVPVYCHKTDMIQHNQMLYPAASLASMIGQEITEMVFYIQSWGANPWSGDGLPGDWIVSFGVTEATALTGLDNTTALTQVYSGAMTFDSGHTTMTITFDNSYTYNGGNLLVDFNHPTTASHRQIYFYGTAVAGAAVYKYGSSVYPINFLPKTTFTYGACPKPTLNDVADEDIEANSATIRWVASDEGQTLFDIYYSTTDTAPTELTTPSYSNVTGTSKELTGLLSSTTYYVWLRGNCGTVQDPNISGGWTEAKTFMTDCGAKDLPYSEHFDTYAGVASGTSPLSSYPEDPLPTCWSFLNRSSSSSTYPMAFLTSSTSYAASGNSLFFKSSNTTPIYAILPEFTDDIASLKLTFKYRYETTFSSNGNLYVGYMTDRTDASTFHTLFTCPKANSLTEVPIYFKNVPAGSSIAFKYGDATSENRYLSIDDIDVTVVSCSPIESFPWHEDFEKDFAANKISYYSSEYAINHPCWENEHILGSGSEPYYLFQVTSSAQGGNSTRMLQLANQFEGNLIKLRLPQMNLPDDNHQFVLDVYRSNHSTFNASEGIRVYASTNGEITGATELAFIPRQYNASHGAIPAEDKPGWYTYEIPIGMSGTCYLILRGESQNCTSTFMDNFVVEPIPECERPSRVTYNDETVTDHSVTLSWTAGNTDQHDWQIAYSTTPFDPNDPSFDINSVDVIDTTLTTCTYRFDKLLATNTTYYIYVRANCSSGDSPWSRKAVTVTTKTAPQAPTSFSVSGIQAYQATFDWEVGGGDFETSWTIYLNDESIDINNTPYGDLVPANLHNFSSHPATITGLTHETAYYAWVRSECGSDGSSSWTALTNDFFTTDAVTPKDLALVDGSETAHGATFTWTGYSDSYDMEYKTVSSRDLVTVFTEDFEETDWLDFPDGWSNENTYSQTQNTWIVWDYGYGSVPSHSGYQCASLYDESTGHNDICYFVTPVQHLSEYSNATLTCWYINRAHQGVDEFGVYYRTSSKGDWHHLFSTNDAHASWTQTPELNLPCEDNVQIGFMYHDHNGYSIGLDDVLITGIKSSSDDWELLESNVTSPYTATTLDPLTTYNVRVKGFLGGEAIGASEPVQFTTTEPCPTPELSNPTIISDQSATLNWTGISSTYTVYYKAEGETDWQQQVGITANTATLTGLTAQTTYQAKVQGNCGSDGISEMSNIVTFKTKCDPTPVDVDNWLTESFDNTTFPPDCWTIGDPIYANYTNKNWGRSTSQKHTGSGSAYSGAYGPIYLFTPIVNITGDLAHLNFWSYEDYPTWYTGGSNDHGGLNIVKVTTNGGSTWTQLWCPTASEVSSAWKSITIDLTSYIGQDIIIAFEYQGNYAHGWYIDDVSIFDGKVFVGGTTDHETDWNTASNWYPSGVPTGDQNVLINSPAQVNEGTAKANAIHLGGSSLTIASGAQLQHNNEGVVATMLRSVAPYTSTKDNYVLVASPLKANTYPTSVDMMISNSYTYDLYAFDQRQTLEWLNYKTSPKPFYTLNNGQGYLYAHNNSGGSINLGFNGEILPSDTDITIDINYYDGYEFSGWNLIGNPFACNAYIKDATDHIAAYYKMNENGDGFTATTDAVNPLEGIFAQATAEDQSLKFTRTAPDAAPGKGNLNINVVQVVTSRDARQATDNAIVRFDGGNKLEKFSFRNGSSKVYFPLENKEFAVVNAEDHGDIPVSFQAEENGTYTISFTMEDVDFNYLHLIDNMTGNDVNLLDTPSYTFEARTIDYASRFRLVFAKGYAELGNDFAFFDANGNLLILGIEGIATLQVMDVTGRVISEETFSGNYSKAINASAGVYMLRLIQGSNVRSQKIVVK